MAKPAKKAAKFSFIPAHDRVLVKPMQDVAKTTTGIYIPDTAKKEERQKGTIVAVGSGRTTDNGSVIPVQFKVGAKVLFRANDWDKEEIDGEEYFLISEGSILGTF